MHLIVASTNPVKVQSAKHGFTQMFPAETFTAEGISVPSGVSDQPMTDEETLQGALNRAINARAAQPSADYWVGIEGGCEEKHGELWTFAWVVVLGLASPRHEGYQWTEPAKVADVRQGVRVLMGKARTGAFMLPQEVANLVRSGIELGHADDQVFGRSNSKQTNGAVGLLTSDLIDRQRYYEHAVILALVPFKNTNLSWG
jgi:non-canonical (house-cleaning) NTP pyrophosphatase